MTRLPASRHTTPWAACAVAFALACAGAAPTRPHQLRANDLPLPADLDVAVRVDVASLASQLGEAPTRQLLLDAVGQSDDPGTARLLERSLSRSALLWVGLPARSEPALSGSVLLLRGQFATLSDGGSAALGWKRQASGVETIELGAPPAGYSRVYRLPGDEVLIWAPRAELPGVERALLGPLDAPVLRPPERGAVSVAVRPLGLLDRYGSRFPALAEHFRGIRRVEAFAEPTAGMWRADLTLDFASAEQAADVSALVERLKLELGKRECVVGLVARALVVSTFGRNVRIQTVLLEPEVEAVEKCVLGNDCCA